MANTKHWKYSERLLALHEEWAVKNGYRDKPQATSVKLQATSVKLQAASDMLNAVNSERFVESAKPQAASVKLQASNGTSSNKR